MDLIEVSKMVVKRKKRGDQFWAKLDTISTYNKQSVDYRATNGKKFAFCYCPASGHKILQTLEEWDAFDFEHREAFSDDRSEWGEIIIDRKSGEVLGEVGDSDIIDALKEGLPMKKYQIGIWEANDYR